MSKAQFKAHFQPASDVKREPELLAACKEYVRYLKEVDQGIWLNNKPGEDLEKAIANAEVLKCQI